MLRLGLALVALAASAPLARAQVSVDQTDVPAAPASAREGGQIRLPDPYPAGAAGWGPALPGGRTVSRWAEDWSAGSLARVESPLKAAPLPGGSFLTLSGELRLRVDGDRNGRLALGDDNVQEVVRGVLGADLRLSPSIGVYGELVTGQVVSGRPPISSNYRNEAAVQQLFVDVRAHLDGMLVGAMAGRQEFADAPRQLIGIGDGPNLHRTFNGLRLYAHGERVRFGAVDLRATRLGTGVFDDEINWSERLQGANVATVLSSGPAGPAYLDLFWFHTDQPEGRWADKVGLDRRDHRGARLWGRRGPVRFDWTVVRQTGGFDGREVDAWGLFAIQSFELSDVAWSPRLGLRLDVASGGGSAGPGALRAYTPPYGGAGYLSEGRFLSLTNLVFLVPSVSATPTPNTEVLVEYGVARRFDRNDFAYAGGMSPYEGTEALRSPDIGRLLRAEGAWAPRSWLTLFVAMERFTPGKLLRDVNLTSGFYANMGATFRY